MPSVSTIDFSFFAFWLPWLLAKVIWKREESMRGGYNVMLLGPDCVIGRLNARIVSLRMYFKLQKNLRIVTTYM